MRIAPRTEDDLYHGIVDAVLSEQVERLPEVGQSLFSGGRQEG